MTQWRNRQMNWTELFQRKKSKCKKKNMEKSMAIKEMQIKTFLIHVRIAVIRNTNNSKCWQGCEEKGTLTHCWWECKLVQPLWETVWRLLNKKTELPYDPTIAFAGKECKSRYKYRYLHTYVYCSIVHNSQAMKTTPRYALLLRNGL
jgi:hypothetical protein